MSPEKKEFLYLNNVLGLKFNDIATRMGVSQNQISSWYKEFKPDREKIAKIRTVWTTKKFTEKFEDFYNWYVALVRKCAYCEITEPEITRLVESGNLETKRIATRGRKLEYDRKEPNQPYNNLDNIVLCCYWCNNAKTDTFTYSEFKEIGKSIANVWRNRLKGKE